jgi:hypothetical protein
MIELVDKYTLVKGNKYYVKGNPIYPPSLKIFECIFDCYEDDTAWLTTNLNIRLYLAFYDFYRYVSKEEFYAKVKEKYDQTCLDLVLKRLVNDDFRW